MYDGRARSVRSEWHDAPDDAAGRDPPSSIPGLDAVRKAAVSAAAVETATAAVEKATAALETATAAALAAASSTPLVRHLNKMKAQLEREQGSSKAKTQNWVDVVESLRPAAEKTSPPPKGIEEVERALDAAVHGMRDVKDVVLGMASLLLRHTSGTVRAIGLVGAPGCGKTSVATRGLGGFGRPVQVFLWGFGLRPNPKEIGGLRRRPPGGGRARGCHGMSWDFMGCHGDAWDAWDVMGCHGMSWDAMGWDAMGCHGMSWDAMGCHGMPWDVMGMPWDDDVMGMSWGCHERGSKGASPPYGMPRKGVQGGFAPFP